MSSNDAVWPCWLWLLLVHGGSLSRLGLQLIHIWVGEVVRLLTPHLADSLHIPAVVLSQLRKCLFPSTHLVDVLNLLHLIESGIKNQRLIFFWSEETVHPLLLMEGSLWGRLLWRVLSLQHGQQCILLSHRSPHSLRVHPHPLPVGAFSQHMRKVFPYLLIKQLYILEGHFLLLVPFLKHREVHLRLDHTSEWSSGLAQSPVHCGVQCQLCYPLLKSSLLFVLLGLWEYFLAEGNNLCIDFTIMVGILVIICHSSL